jgi:2-polyprenyl-3-methyl-5-hydroxy-6-metoxy-1,4-benzoquinol methylase
MPQSSLKASEAITTGQPVVVARSTSSYFSRVVKHLYADAPVAARTILSFRPFICPFGALVELVPNQSRVLDVGCGRGLFLALLAHKGRLAEGVGYDISEKSLDAARIMHARLSKYTTAQLQFVLGEAGGDLPDGTFDVVSMIDVLHHVNPRSQEQAISAAAAKVRPGGLLLYKDIAKRPLWRATANRIHDLLMAREWIHYRSIQCVENWLHCQGFKVVKSTSYYMFCYHHELRVFQHALS